MDAVTVNATTGDDTIEVTPLDASAGTLQANGADPVVNYSNTNTLGVVVDALGGEDTLVVNATSAIDTVTVDVPGSTVDTGGFGGLVTFDGDTEALTVNGLEGDDAFAVTPGVIPVFVDGGDPIGIEGDTIEILAGGADTTFAPGPEGDEAGIAVVGSETVSYDHIEGAAITGPGVLTICGTNGDDDITVVGTGANDFWFAINDGPKVDVTNATGLEIEAKAGDDDIEIDVDVDGALIAFPVVISGGYGGPRHEPSTDNDTVTVAGVLGDFDDPEWTPTGSDEGDLELLGGQRIELDSIENLIYDGESEGDFLTVFGILDEDDLFQHTPGGLPDAGRVDIVAIDSGRSLLGISYQNLGLDNLVQDSGVMVDGNGGDDTLVALGTGGSDVLDVRFTGPEAIAIDLGSSIGTHVDLLSTDVDNYEIRSLEGDDDINIDGLVDADSFAVFGGGPGAGSDTLHLTGTGNVDLVTIAPDSTDSDDQDIDGLGATIDVTGIELITYDGENFADTLTVDPGFGDHSVRVDDAATVPFDRVTSDSLPQIEFGGLATFVVNPSGFGNDEVTFVTRNLTGASAYEAVLDGNDTLVIEGANGSNDDYTARVPVAGSVEVADAAGATVTETSGALGRLQINTLGGDDVVTVDDSTGLITPLITYDGGSGSDALVTRGTLPVEQVEYMPGPDTVEGRLLYDLDWQTPDSHDMTIDFLNLEPVIDLVPKTVAMTVYGTNADNAINYIEGPNSGITDPVLNPTGFLTGMVSVDGFETIEFANFIGIEDVLEIIGLAGDDVINVNHQGLPDPVAPLERIWVEGNDPTASDKLIVNAFDGIVDTLTVTPGDAVLGPDGRVSGSDVNYLPVDYIGVEELVLVGQLDADLGLGLFDTFAVDGTLGEDVFEYFTGDTPDTGTVRGLMNVISATPFALPEITFQGMHPAGVRSFGMTTYDPANNDDFVFYATSLDDEIVYDGSTLPAYHSLTDSIDGTLVTNIQLSEGITGVVISAENGSDTIDVTPGDGVSVIVQGGNPGGGSDVMNYHAVGETTVELATRDIEDAGYGGTREASFSGIEVLNVDAAASQFNVTATDVDDDVTVTVYDASSGMVQHGYAAQRAGQVASEIADPVIYYSNTDGNAANFNLGDGEDTLVVIGSTYGTTPPAIDEPQVFDVNASDTDTTIPGRLPDPVPARQVRVDNEGDNVNDGIVTWVQDGIESLEVWGLEGDDTFNVVPGPIPVFIDGGDPIGTTAGDLINIIADGDPVVFEPGPESDEGGFIVGARQRVSFDHIEALGVFNAAKAIIYGTADDDEITVIARDDSTHPALAGLTPGEQDFTTTVNQGPEILWADTPLVFIDGSSGDDDITLRMPAPNTALWNVDVFVAGGPASTPELGDRLRVETPYENNYVDYLPTAPDSGIMEIYNDPAKEAANRHSTIYIGTWDLDHDGDEIVDYFSSPGGVETLLYDGISAEGKFDHNNDTGETNQETPTAFTDTLTILGDGFDPADPERDPADELFTHTPGSEPDAGSVTVVDLTHGQTMLGISYNNIGLDGLVTIDGQDGTDTLVALGTGGSDVMEVAFSATDAIDVDLTSSVGAHVDLFSLQIENYQIRPEEGDDEVTVVAPVLASGDFAVLGGGPAEVT